MIIVDYEIWFMWLIVFPHSCFWIPKTYICICMCFPISKLFYLAKLRVTFKSERVLLVLHMYGMVLQMVYIAYTFYNSKTLAVKQRDILFCKLQFFCTAVSWLGRKDILDINWMKTMRLNFWDWLQNKQLSVHKITPKALFWNVTKQ